MLKYAFRLVKMVLLLCCYSTFFVARKLLEHKQQASSSSRGNKGSSNGEGRKRQVWGSDLNLGKMGCPQPTVFLHIKWEVWAELDEFFSPFSVCHSRSLCSRDLKFILNQSCIATRERSITFLWLVPKRLSLRPWRCWILRQGLSSLVLAILAIS